MPVLSLIDFAYLYKNETPKDGFRRSIEIAKKAEHYGFKRIWYTEHHNMPTVASSAPAILIAHVANHTSRIRLGAGGVMLPNHAPLVVAEQYGSLAELHPNRIDIGIGRAPGTDKKTMYCLRRTFHAEENFESDIAELQGFLGNHSRVAGIGAYPGKGTHIPLYLLGSSLYSARLAAELGLPYVFASHFAPKMLYSAISTYKNDFRPSEKLSEPYAIAALNVIAANTHEEAQAEFELVKRARIRSHIRDLDISDADLDTIMDTDGALNILQQLTFTAVGTGEETATYLKDFASRTEVDELMLCIQAISNDSALQTLDIVGKQYTTR